MTQAGGRTPVNINVGLLGHVDSGKTSLAKALSTQSSTAAFDKSPQSQARGITLDLGFSTFSLPAPPQFQEKGYDAVQVTLVDCPGHASLIRTIIGGAQIIDMMILVIDIVKGIQTQTAECLVVGEILTDHMIVALNKVDLIDEKERDEKIGKMTTKLRKTFQHTKFVGCPIIPVAANVAASDDDETRQIINLAQLTDALSAMMPLPSRSKEGSFVFAVDHCFAMKGQGTVMTGTILKGSVAVGDTIEIPALQVQKKIKSMQMYRKPVQSAMQGDRLGICVTQLNADTLERGILCAPGSVSLIDAAVVRIHRISYFKGSIGSKSKFHVTIGHETVMGRITLFEALTTEDTEFDTAKEYRYVAELDEAIAKSGRPVFALIEFDSRIPSPSDAHLIGSRLDSDINANACRIAFHGKVLFPMADKNYKEKNLKAIRVFKTKHKTGQIERLADEYTVIAKGLFKKDSPTHKFAGLNVHLSSGETGVIEGSFGQSGKVRVSFRSGVPRSVKDALEAKQMKTRKPTRPEEATATDDVNDGNGADATQLPSPAPLEVTLQFKRFIFDHDHRLLQ